VPWPLPFVPGTKILADYRFRVTWGLGVVSPFGLYETKRHRQVRRRNPDHWAVDAVGAPHVGERTEKELISAFCDKIAELSPQLTLAYSPIAKMSLWKR